jgi:hypothetical protein
MRWRREKLLSLPLPEIEPRSSSLWPSLYSDCTTIYVIYSETNNRRFSVGDDDLTFLDKIIRLMPKIFALCLFSMTFEVKTASQKIKTKAVKSFCIGI